MSAARVFEEGIYSPAIVAMYSPFPRIVAVSAYTGADLLLEDVNFRVATSSIITNEARHQSAMNVLNGGSESPQSFGVALRPEQALSVLAPFISGCDIDIPVVKPLKLKSHLQAGVPIKFDMTNLPNDKQVR